MAEVISVSALNRYVKNLLDVNDVLFDLALRGEIANFVQNARSGHCYFSLRDEAASVRAVMFRSDARRLGFQPEEGMKVVVRCRVTLYERDGAFQVYVNDMFPDGIGSTQLALEQLKAKLDKEGLFAPEHKKPLPRFPQCIGLVTSKTGAALQDIRNVIGRRWPAVRLLLAPVNVQGFEAAEEIADAITRLDKSELVDEIIVARGGGSREGSVGIQCRGHCPGGLPLQNAPHQRHWSRDRFYDPGFCGRSARAHALSGGRACCARPCRTRTEIMHFGRKYSQLYPI